MRSERQPAFSFFHSVFLACSLDAVKVRPRGNTRQIKNAVDEYGAIHKLSSPLKTKDMRTKNPQAFRLSSKAVEALESEAARTGKSKTGVIEDLLLWQRLFSDEAQAAMEYMAQKHKLPARKVAEVALMKAAGMGGELPFEMPLAA